MSAVTFGDGRRALRFGTSKINLHQAGHEFEPKARRPTPGSEDLCFIVDDAIEDVLTQLTAAGVAVEEGPVTRTGATGEIISCYLRDPDGNLIELSNYQACWRPRRPLGRRPAGSFRPTGTCTPSGRGTPPSGRVAREFAQAAGLAEAAGFRPGRHPHDLWPRAGMIGGWT